MFRYEVGKDILGYAIAVALGFVLFLVTCSGGELDERNKVWLKLQDKDVEFNCNTDTECYRDCMELIDDADECERGLMEGGR
jgi:hypothetical protein